MRYRVRYPENWEEIALAVKEQAEWRCRKCNMQCIRPGEDTSKLTKSERTAKTEVFAVSMIVTSVQVIALAVTIAYFQIETITLG